MDKNGDVTVGAPAINGLAVHACREASKGDKVLIFKKKRRKGYQKLNGFRPYLARFAFRISRRQQLRKQLLRRKVSTDDKPAAKKATAKKLQQRKQQLISNC